MSLDLKLSSRGPGWLSARNANWLGFLACVGLMAYALYVQYGLHQEPCPLCILQRIVVVVMGGLFLAAALHDPIAGGGRVYGALLAVAALAGMAIAGRHVWIIAQPPGSVAECGATLDYMLDVLPLHEVLGKVLTGSGECAKVDWTFLGLSMPAWVLMNLAALGTWGLLMNWRVARRSTRF